MNRTALAVLTVLLGIFGVVAVRVLLKPHSASSRGPHKVTLSWNAAISANPEALRYNVFRSSDNGRTFTQIATKVSGTKYEDLGVEAGATYLYQVSTVDPQNNKESVRTPPVSVTVPGNP
jgi:fibronectin type 3 domain-containing protein